jgi:membrane-associated protein
MDEFLEILKNLTDPEWIVRHGGLYIVMLIIFLETGLFLGFFLPGDYLLFITGIIIANTSIPFEHSWANLVFWNVLLVICAVLGNYCGYWFGYKSGPFLFERKDSFLFKKRHLEQARSFYARRGGVAIVIARFLPIIRTFAPIVAGIVKMDLKIFTAYNISGALIWVFSLVTIGFVFGDNEQVKHYLDVIVLGIFLVTTVPVIYKLIRFKTRSRHDQ